MRGLKLKKEKLYNVPQEKTFTMLIGLPGTGKTTFAKNLLDYNSANRILISSDRIRFDLLNYHETGIDFDPKIEPKVWKIVNRKMNEALKDPTVKEVIFDATNLRKSRRKTFLKLAQKNEFRTRGILFSGSLGEVKARNQERERNVPEEVIERFSRILEDPEEGEFDKIYRFDI
jgi:predicted kinase